MTGQAPLSQAVALYGGFTYVIPSAPAGDPTFIGQNYSEAYWNATFGLVWSFGCKAAMSCSSPAASMFRSRPGSPVAARAIFRRVFADLECVVTYPPTGVAHCRVCK